MKCFELISVLVCMVAANGLAGGQDPTPPASLLSLCRMGAGSPAGWNVSGDNFTWEVEGSGEEQAHGSRPFVSRGAARIRFGKGGRLTLESPARLLRSGAAHSLQVWLRSSPPGARLQLCISDNDSKGGPCVEQRFTARETWTPAWLHEVLPAAVKGRYYVTLAAQGDDTTLWLDGLWLGETEDPPAPDRRPAGYAAGVVLEPTAPWGLVTGDALLEVRARVAGVTEAGAVLDLRAVHTNGQSARLPPVPLDHSGFWEGAFEIAGEIAEPFGMIRVEAAVLDAQGEVLSPTSETLLARAPVPGPCPESPFGVHVSLREPDVEAVAKLGYKWCRIHDASKVTKWAYVEPEPGQWTWYDEDIALARKHGLCILGLLDGSPPWESGTTKEGYFRIYGAPRNMDNWRAYVRSTVSHYAGTIDAWEVWNEPWDMQRFFHGGTPQLYVALLAAAYEEAKAANPGCTVVGIDTYPPLWEKVVLAMGAYPHYDVLSWHRYDPGLHGRPNDAIARVAERLRKEQAAYGSPKPLLCSEGGPDVAHFHGSFFSFADPAIVGDWSRGGDQYARMFLSAIEAGNQRFIAYSMHNAPRHGQPIHMMIEPGYLLRPMHLTLAALAHFIEGADFEKRLAPAQDITALVFRQANARPYSPVPSTVVVLFADGEESEALPVAIPREVRCFDRWGNPAPTPGDAVRSPTYLVAAGETAQRLLVTRSRLRRCPELLSRPARISTCSSMRPLPPSAMAHPHSIRSLAPRAPPSSWASPEGIAWPIGRNYAQTRPCYGRKIRLDLCK